MVETSESNENLGQTWGGQNENEEGKRKHNNIATEREREEKGQTREGIVQNKFDQQGRTISSATMRI